MTRSEKGRLAKKNIAKKNKKARLSVAVFCKDDKGRYTDRSFTLSLIGGLLLAYSPFILLALAVLIYFLTQNI